MDKKLNIINILTDDMGEWAMGCSGNSEIKTPHLDSLAEKGMKLNNCYCVSPVCSPARASIFTGRIPSFHGVQDWIAEGNSPLDNPEGRCIDYLENITLFTELLAEKGYFMGYSGKWHLGDSPTPQKGHDFWYTHAFGGGPYYGATMYKDGKETVEEEYITDRITDEGLSFLNQTLDKDKPFCLTLSYTAPHSPWDRDNHPKEYYDEYYKNCPFESVPDLPIHPWHINTSSVGYSPEKRREILSGYYASISSMDSNVGRILDWLRQQGIEENTIVSFTSDNGMNMGHHGIYGKGNGTFPQNMFETSVKVPTLISCPGVIPAGTELEAPVSHYDIYPTFMDLLGFEKNPDLPGSSWRELLENPEKETDRPVVIFSEYGPVRMIRKGDYKYVHRYPFGPHELYNLKKDPREYKNLFGFSEFSEISQNLKREMIEWFLLFSRAEKDGRSQAIYGKGQCDIIGNEKGSEPFRDDMLFFTEAKDSLKDFSI